MLSHLKLRVIFRLSWPPLTKLLLLQSVAVSLSLPSLLKDLPNRHSCQY